MMAEIKSGEAASRRNLRVKIMLERITGAIADDGWSSKAMDRGREMEPAAVQAYEALQGVIVSTVGFVSIDGVEAGASPDGLVGSNGVVEAKCPLSGTHLEYLRSGKIPGGYFQQCRHLLWVTGRDWIEEHSIHLVVHGSDYSQEDLNGTHAIPIEMGILRIVDYTARISTTEIIRRVLAEAANLAPGKI